MFKNALLLVRPWSLQWHSTTVAILPWKAWPGGPRATTMEAAHIDMVPDPNDEQTRVVYLDGELLLKYVERRLARGDHFVDVAEALGIGRNILRRRLQELGWRGVYDTPSVASGDVMAAIRSEVPVMRAGVNWGIRSVQCRLRLSGLRLGRQAVRDALHNMQPEHMERRQLGRLRRGQYTITKPMILWHMDCENFPIYPFQKNLFSKCLSFVHAFIKFS